MKDIHETHALAELTTADISAAHKVLYELYKGYKGQPVVASLSDEAKIALFRLIERNTGAAYQDFFMKANEENDCILLVNKGRNAGKSIYPAGVPSDDAFGDFIAQIVKSIAKEDDEMLEQGAFQKKFCDKMAELKIGKSWFEVSCIRHNGCAGEKNGIIRH